MKFSEDKKFLVTCPTVPASPLRRMLHPAAAATVFPQTVFFLHKIVSDLHSFFFEPLSDKRFPWKSWCGETGHKGISSPASDVDCQKVDKVKGSCRESLA